MRHSLRKDCRGVSSRGMRFSHVAWFVGLVAPGRGGWRRGCRDRGHDRVDRTFAAGRVDSTAHAVPQVEGRLCVDSTQPFEGS